MANFFVSSHCRTCYKGRQLDAAWRRSRFNTLRPLIFKISPEVYRQAEEHQATVLLEKTAIEEDFTLPDVFKLGLTEEDIKIFRVLRRKTYPPVSALGQPKGHTSFDSIQPQSRSPPADLPA